MANNNKSVQVAVRVRPLVPSEISKGCKEILEIYSEIGQIRVQDSDKGFTYNHVFGAATNQQDVYNGAVKNLIPNLFKGYNLTILAYGQTGSGKTHSMGTTYNGNGDMGVIPRAVEDIFSFMKDNFCYDFTVTVSFMELYQEVLYDLLSEKNREQNVLDIREDSNKGILIPGLCEIEVKSPQEVFAALARGSIGRATASTNMNSQSSRSHAIFTINILMQSKNDCNDNKSAKFNLVDLAGSERQKKTGAVGNTFREGVNINKGLLVLGNVISALGDEKGPPNFVPYRDSNLTRLLKDSLGGNSITLMIACVSPADYNLDETLSTLRYADRARKIQNKPIVNQDAKSAEINELKKTIQQLRLQLVGDSYCPAEVELLRKDNLELKEKLRQLTLEFSGVLHEKTGLLEKIMILQTANEELYKKITEFKEEFNVTLGNISVGFEKMDVEKIKENMKKFEEMKNQLKKLETEQVNTEDEIRNHDELSHILHNNQHGDVQTETAHLMYTNRQRALNTELKEISKDLVMKEQLAQQILKNAQYMVDYEALAENQAKIQSLQKEKDELLQQLKNIQNNECASKNAEQRRKRVQDLESQLHDLNRKVQEQARLIKLKEKDEQKIKSLNMEILQMKQTKVKLIKAMREESDKFKSWKQDRERELAKLKHEDRKKQNQIVKMEAMHNKQQNVLKRKVEEAVALNKRLKDALAVRKQAQDSRNHSKFERTGNWIKEEFDVFIHLMEAEATLGGLLEDRGVLHQQLEALKSDPNADPKEIKAISEDIDLRSLQIQDLQQKMLDSDEETRSKTRFDAIQSMAESKHALKYVFERVAQLKKKEVAEAAKTIDLQAQLMELNEKLSRAEQHTEQLEKAYKEKVQGIERDCEERVGVLLRQLRGVTVQGNDEELKQRCLIQEKALQEQENKNFELEKQVKELNRKLRFIQELGNETYSEFHQNQLQEGNIKKPREQHQEPAKKSNRKLTVTPVPSPGDENLDISIDIDDREKDPDWKKTPLGKWLNNHRNRKRPNLQKTQVLFPDDDRGISVKRGSDGGCTCTKSCTRRCSCKKVNKSCTSLCKCSTDSCVNRSEEKFPNNESDGSDSADAASFKKPLSEEAIPTKIPRKPSTK